MDSACLTRIVLASSNISHANCKFDGSSSSSFSTSWASPWSLTALASLSSEPIVSFSTFSFSPSDCFSPSVGVSGDASCSSPSTLFSSDSASYIDIYNVHICIQLSALSGKIIMVDYSLLKKFIFHLPPSPSKFSITPASSRARSRRALP